VEVSDVTAENTVETKVGDISEEKSVTLVYRAISCTAFEIS